MKIAVMNLALIVTEKCNLNCGHCLRGGCSDKCMSDEVIDATLSQFCHIHNLAICGGEVTLALDRIEKIFSYIIDNNISVDMVTLIINGTIYSDEFLKLLDEIDGYINIDGMRKSLSTFTISSDKYHDKEINRLGIRDMYLGNVEHYRESRHFYGLQKLRGKLIREGNANELSRFLSKDFHPMRTLITYMGQDYGFDRDGICFIGPFVTVNVDGNITECDSSIEHQRNLYNYGNVLVDSIEDVCLERGKVFTNYKKWLRENAKEFRKY